MMTSSVYGRMLSVLSIMLCFCYATSYVVDGGRYRGRSRGGSGVVIKYNRIDEAKKECSFLLNSASDLKPADDIVSSLKEELSFLNGDWLQVSNKAPLMPYYDTNVVSSSSQSIPFGSLSDPNSSLSNLVTIDPIRSSNLVSFWVTDVSTARRSKKWIAVNGAMMIGMTTQSLFLEMPNEGSHFDIWYGQSQLTVMFQGFYAETESGENGGERVMCLMGNAMLPAHGTNSDDPWEREKTGYSNQPPLVEDDQILLVLRYPKTFSLLNRGIQGSMKSLNSKSRPGYFDEVRISSWPDSNAIYAFGSEETVSKACDPYPSKDAQMNGELELYKGLDICMILDKFMQQDAFKFAPNWNCNGTDEYCTKLGPFGSDKKDFKDFKLVIQDLRCSEESSEEEGGFRRISSVFRAFPTSQEIFFVTQRTDLSNMTVTAEGIWKSSSGQVCMAGCIGGTCNSRICLYIPISFSINQRSIVMGTFSSLEGSNNGSSFFPLTFQKLARPGEFWNQYGSARPFYKYSKMDAARAILEKDEPDNFGNTVKKSLLKFPKLEEAESSLVSLSLLSDDLALHISAVPDPSPESFVSRPNLQVEILSLGPLFGRYWSSNGLPSEEDKPYSSEAVVSEKQLPINVSGQIDLMGVSYDNFSAISVEGLYNPQVGKMYLIGCKEVQAPWKILHDSITDLEAGMDCSIEVIISYPPTTSRWLVNPTAWISISSQRNEDDPLFFKPLKLQTLPVVYRKQREDILSRRGIEGLLRILMLSLAITSLLSQIFHIRKNMDSVPYTSLVMLGIQGVGYSIPLITGAEAIFEKMGAESESYENRSYEQLHKGQAIRMVEYMVKLLVLVAFSLTMRLCQKVWRSRIRLLTRTPLEPHRVPSDRRVLLSILIIHSVGYALVLLVHSVTTLHRPPQVDKFIDSSGHSRAFHEWLTEFEEYFGLIQDCFLLPQIIGNYVWRLHGKPLRKMYYVGITVTRLLPHVYDLSRSEISNPYFSNEYEFMNPNLGFFSKLGDIAIPLMAVVLAVVVYVQQRWNYVEIKEGIGRGAKVYERLGSKVYERLPSMNFEAEMSAGANDVSRST